MKERPILFSGPMVRAILEGRKTMTRRVCKPRYDDRNACEHYAPTKYSEGLIMARHCEHGSEGNPCPYGVLGDRLWVRETFRIESVGNYVPYTGPYEDVGIVYAADGEKRNIHREHPSARSRACHNNKPSIFMPRWASRITLEITGVRVEHLQEITEPDAVMEGVDFEIHCDAWHDYMDEENVLPSAVQSFASLWSKINGRESWDANPWVWVVEFRRIEK